MKKNNIDINKIFKHILFFDIVYTILMNFFISMFHIPTFFKGIIYIFDLLLLIYVIINFKKIFKNKYIKLFLIIIVLMIIGSLISIIYNRYSLILYIIGFRNTYKFFIFFFSVFYLFDEFDIKKYLKIQNCLFIINVIIVFIEFLIFKYERDYLSGSFAFGTKGGNTGLITLFSIQLALVLNLYLTNKISFFKLAVNIALILIISAIAELKIVYVIFCLFLIFSVFLNKINKKTLLIIGLGLASLIFGIKILASFYPEWENFFSISGLYDNFLNSNHGYSTKDDLSRVFAFKQINTMFFDNNIFNKIFGYGVGNCDCFASLKIYSNFYLKYSNSIHYHWFTHAFIYLENGIYGLMLFISFFILNIILCFYMMKKNTYNKYNYLFNASICLSIFYLISIWYDSFLRIEYAYFLYCFMAFPYIIFLKNNYNDKLKILISNNSKYKEKRNNMKKKVGIMSMQRIYNYGSFMQSYCLMNLLKQLDFDVEFIDYHYEKTIVKSKNNINKTELEKNNNIIVKLKKKMYHYCFKKKYNFILNKYLSIKSDFNFNHNLDYLVIGSDEVFNCLQGYPVGYSKELFGYGYEKIPTISYAGCFGHTTYNDLCKYNINCEISVMLERFKDISVRDKNSFLNIKKLTNISPNLNLDPVLVFDFQTNEKIDNIIKRKYKNYILIYSYEDRMTGDEKNYIKTFAEKHNKNIISIGSFQDFADKNLVINPLNVFYYFKYADLVITDTFHGSIFSIKSHANFVTIIRKSNKNKLGDLLNRLDKNERIVTNIKKIDILYSEKINFESTDKILNIEKEKTKKYLQKNLI